MLAHDVAPEHLEYTHDLILISNKNTAFLNSNRIYPTVGQMPIPKPFEAFSPRDSNAFGLSAGGGTSARLDGLVLLTTLS